MTISTQDIQALRQQTGVGILEARKALQASAGDPKAALEALRKAGVKVAAQKSSRAVKEGAVGYYLHSNKKVGALVSIACETDFVARTEDFQSLAHDLALHVAAANPLYLRPADVPADVREKEETVYRSQLEAAGKPKAMWGKILPGKMQKYYRDVCLLEQPFVKDDTMSVGELVNAAIAKLGENIQVTSFARLTV